MKQHLIAFINAYNVNIAAPKGKPLIPTSIINLDNSMVRFACNATIIGNQTYGKFPTDGMADQVMMEYAPFLPFLSDNLPAALADQTDFRLYLQKNGSALLY